MSTARRASSTSAGRRRSPTDAGATSVRTRRPAVVLELRRRRELDEDARVSVEADLDQLIGSPGVVVRATLHDEHLAVRRPFAAADSTVVLRREVLRARSVGMDDPFVVHRAL